MAVRRATPSSSRRQIHELPQPAAERAGRPRPRTLREEEREVQEERRQQEHRHRIGPVEEPVETIEAAAEREGRPAEEGRREPEEMKRRRVTRPAQAHDGANQQREQADRCEDVVEARVPARDRRQGELEGLRRPEPEQPIGDRLPLLRSTQEVGHIRRPLDELAVNRLEQVAGPDPGAARRRAGRDAESGDAFDPTHPEHTVVSLVPRGTDDEVRDPEPEEQCRHGDRDDRRPRRRPTGPAPSEGGRDDDRASSLMTAGTGRDRRLSDQLAIDIPQSLEPVSN